MNINELIAIVKKKLLAQIIIENLKIEDKTFLHKNHKGNQDGKFHLKISIQPKELKEMNTIERNKNVHKISQIEIKNIIHSLQLSIS